MGIEDQHSIGLAIKSVSNLLDRRMHAHASLLSGDRTTPMQGHIIRYLYECQEQGELFQRDVEQRFDIRRSTATGILNLMERNGLIRRETVSHDARLKKLVLTPHAVEHHLHFSHLIAENEALMSQDLTPAELETFFVVMRKIRANLE